MKGKIETYNKNGQFMFDKNVTGFITSPDEDNESYLFISLPVKEEDKGINKHITITISELFNEIKRKLNFKQ